MHTITGPLAAPWDRLPGTRPYSVLTSLHIFINWPWVLCFAHPQVAEDTTFDVRAFRSRPGFPRIPSILATAVPTVAIFTGLRPTFPCPTTSAYSLAVGPPALVCMARPLSFVTPGASPELFPTGGRLPRPPHHITSLVLCIARWPLLLSVTLSSLTRPVGHGLLGPPVSPSRTETPFLISARCPCNREPTASNASASGRPQDLLYRGPAPPSFTGPCLPVVHPAMPAAPCALAIACFASIPHVVIAVR